MEMKEIWVDIRGYEGIYKISNLGNVKSVTRTIKMSHGGVKTQLGVILKQNVDNCGYYKVNLCDNNRKSKTWRIHTLVAMHFVDNLNGYNFVNHKNEDKLDNRASNLFWTTNIENNSRGASIGHKIRKIGKGA